MRFSDKRQEFKETLELVCLLISFGAIFLQIWLLLSGLEAFFQKRYENLLPSVFLSGLAFLACVICTWLTKMDFLKGITEGRTKTYQKKN